MIMQMSGSGMTPTTTHGVYTENFILEISIPSNLIEQKQGYPRNNVADNEVKAIVKPITRNARGRVYANPDLCTGCGLCMAACSVRMFGESSPAKSAIQIKRDPFEGYEVQFICRHCENPRCVEACFMGITEQNSESGLVCSRHHECVGCMSCLMVCPYGAIRRVVIDQSGREVAVRCDGCPERDVPACVVICPTQALIFK